MKELCRLDPRNRSLSVDMKQLESAISTVQLSAKIPQGIREMIDLAKRVFLYGYYEYDFFTLSVQYLFLVAETAAKERILCVLPEDCRLTKGKKSKLVRKNCHTIYENLQKRWVIEGFTEINRTFDSILKFLKAREILPQRISVQFLDSLRQLRNNAAHLTGKDALHPATVVPAFHMVIDFTNCLFDTKSHENEPQAIKQTRAFYEKVSKKLSELSKED
jgi:hypothetical protein